MIIQEIIKKKRDGGKLSTPEIQFFIQGSTDGTIPDYQLSALLMAILLRGMVPTEISAMAMAMARSGEVVDLGTLPGVKVDKHSTGGVGDKVSLVLAPLVASLGVKVPMISGRGLGHTGGTLDKLESIPGYNVRLSLQEFKKVLGQVGCSLIGQTDQLAPADRCLYSLRDVTGTVESVALITSSILSKKIAAGIDALVMDVKVGSGAFMKNLSQAEELASALIATGKEAGKWIVAVLTDMQQPLGVAIGNALEVEETLAALSGNGPADLMEVTLELGYWMLKLAGIEEDRQAAFKRMWQAIGNGSALKKFAELIAAQGGNPDVCARPELLPRAQHCLPLKAESSGYLHSIDTEAVGMAALLLGAGRQRAEEQVDPAVGLKVFKRLGDRVEKSEKLLEIHYNDDKQLKEISGRLLDAYRLSSHPVKPPPLILKTLS